MIYFILSPEQKAFKVGVALTPGMRRSILQIGNPQKLKIDFCIKGTQRKESEIHKKLAKYKIRGEWDEY
jgi:hypothetical protein